MTLAHFRMLVAELLNEDLDMVPKEAPLIVLDSKSAQCMLHCTHFLHWIVQLVLEHVYHDQLVNLDSKLYSLLYFFQCLDNPAN